MAVELSTRRRPKRKRRSKQLVQFGTIFATLHSETSIQVLGINNFAAKGISPAIPVETFAAFQRFPLTRGTRTIVLAFRRFQ